MPGNWISFKLYCSLALSHWYIIFKTFSPLAVAKVTKITSGGIMTKTSVTITFTFGCMSMSENIIRKWVQRKRYWLFTRQSIFGNYVKYFQEEERIRLMCQGQNALRKLRNEYNRLLETYSVLVMPTVPTVAKKLPPKDITIKGTSLAIMCRFHRNSQIIQIHLFL